MNSIPLVRARYAKNIVTAFEQKGVSVDDYLVRAQLPMALLSHGDNVITTISLLTFVDLACLGTGILDIGFWAGRTALEDHGFLGYKVSHAPDLHSAIKIHINEARTENAVTDLYLAHDERSIWFCRGPAAGTPNQRQQVELYSIMIMMQTIQLALGSSWRPEWLRLQSTNRNEIVGNNYLQQLNIEFGTSVTSIEMPVTALAMPLRPAKADPGIFTQPYALLFGEPLAAIRQLLDSYLPFIHFPDIKYFASMVGISPRAFQHYLQGRGVTFTQMADQARSERAITLMHQSNTITDIAYELGFSDAAHFSRFFTRMLGLSPRKYRQNIRQ